MCLCLLADNPELSSGSTADVSTSIVESSGSKSMGLVCEPAASVPLKSTEPTPSGVGFQTLCSCVRLQCGISVRLHYVSKYVSEGSWRISNNFQRTIKPGSMRAANP